MSSFVEENPKICCSPCREDIWAFHLHSRVSHLFKTKKPGVCRIKHPAQQNQNNPTNIIQTKGNKCTWICLSLERDWNKNPLKYKLSWSSQNGQTLKATLIYSMLASITNSLEYIAKVRNIMNSNLQRISLTRTCLPGRTCVKAWLYGIQKVKTGTS